MVAAEARTEEMEGGETEVEVGVVEGGEAEEGAAVRVDSAYGGIWERNHTMMQKMIPTERAEFVQGF